MPAYRNMPETTTVNLFKRTYEKIYLTCKAAKAIE